MLTSRTEPNRGKQTLTLEMVFAGFKANNAKVEGPLLI